MITRLRKLCSQLLTAVVTSAVFIVGLALMFDASTLGLLRLQDARLTSASITDPIEVNLPPVLER